MAYTKQNFVNGEILTHTKLNAMDDQIALNESGKVDKVTGKGLSTNDYDDAEKLSLKVTSEELAAEIKKLRNIIELNRGVTFTETTDTTAAMTKTVPANAQSYAEVRKIGGKTQVVSGELKSAAVTAVKSYGSGSVLIDTKTIPAAVQALPGYGWSAGAVCNEIDWQRMVYVQRVGSVDLGTLAWEMGSTYVSGKHRVMSETISNIASPVQSSTIANIICAAYATDNADSTYMAVNGKCAAYQSKVIVFDDEYSSSTSAADFKTAMNGVMLYYELATPIETDISAMMTADDMITVAAGGSIVFENANSMAPNSTVSYMVKAGE